MMEADNKLVKIGKFIAVKIAGAIIGLCVAGGGAVALISDEQISHLKTEIGAYVLDGIKANKDKARETLSVIVFDAAKNNTEYMKNYFLKNTVVTSDILNKLLPSNRDDIKAILRNVSADTRKQVKDILDEISREK